jgi:hypothetical protein
MADRRHYPPAVVVYVPECHGVVTDESTTRALIEVLAEWIRTRPRLQDNRDGVARGWSWRPALRGDGRGAVCAVHPADDLVTASELMGRRGDRPRSA